MSLEKFFSPASVAIVGASQTPGKVGYEIVKNMVKAGFEGKIYPINPQAKTIEGLTCYPDLVSIGLVPDLVVIVVPAKVVASVMEQCGKAGVKTVVVITAGFKEVGPEGKELEEQILQIALQFGIRFIGPNCLGVISPAHKVNASFGGDLPESGVIGYLSQSGALLAAILDAANMMGIGFNKLASIGNKADVDELDLIKYFGADPEVKVIAGYLESITDGDAFLREAERISQRKPILLMKSGGTQAGARAASSHTGSLAGSETAYECMFDRAGIIRCLSIKTQFDFARTFVSQPLPEGRRVAVITNAGGPGIMAADAIERNKLEFAKLSEETIATLKTKLPAAANFHNPVDILGDALADRYEFAIETVLKDPGVDAALILLTPQAMTESKKTAEIIVEVLRKKQKKTVLTCFLGGSQVADAVELLRKEHIPYYDSPEIAILTLRVMADYVLWRSRPKRVVKMFPVNRRKVENIIERNLRAGIADMDEADSKEVLEAYGFVTPKGAIATTSEQAANIADQMGFPVVMKIWSQDIVHKSDCGGVVLGLESKKEVMDAFDLMMYRIPKKLPNARVSGVLVQEMCRRGKEVVIGMNRDPHFGPLIMFGMGGTMVEVLKDVTFHLAPLTAEEAKQMLMNTKTYKILKGVRGEEGVDLDAIAESLQRLSQLVTEFPQIQEMDINPYIVGPAGTVPVAVDARMRIEQV
jgi:acetyl coenzyme A synthetase (ADP forming)-like protein